MTKWRICCWQERDAVEAIRTKRGDRACDRADVMHVDAGNQDSVDFDGYPTTLEQAQRLKLRIEKSLSRRMAAQRESARPDPRVDPRADLGFNRVDSNGAVR